MPQLNPEFWATQIFWLAVCFGLFYILLSRLALPRIAATLEERRDKIADELDQAAQMKRQSEEAQAEYEAALAESRAQAQAIAQETRQRLQQEAEEQQRKLDADLRERAARAEEELAAAHRRARESIPVVAAELAGAIARHLAGADVSPERLKESAAAALAGRASEGSVSHGV